MSPGGRGLTVMGSGSGQERGEAARTMESVGSSLNQGWLPNIEKVYVDNYKLPSMDDFTQLHFLYFHFVFVFYGFCLMGLW